MNLLIKDLNSGLWDSRTSFINSSSMLPSQREGPKGLGRGAFLEYIKGGFSQKKVLLGGVEEDNFTLLAECEIIL